MNPLHYIRMKWRHRNNKNPVRGLVQIDEGAIWVGKKVLFGRTVGYVIKIGTYTMPGFYSSPLDALECCNAIRKGLGLREHNVWSSL